MSYNGDPFQWGADRLVEIMTFVNGPLEPLYQLQFTTPLSYTTQHPLIVQTWTSMLLIADGFLGLLVIVSAIQMMYGQSMGSLQMPPGQFVARLILAVALMHLSAFFLEQLLIINNYLSGMAVGNMQLFVARFTGGKFFDNRQIVILTILLTICFGIGLFRMIFRSIKRIILFNMLFILSGFAFLSSIHDATSFFFAGWMRLTLAIIFEQFFVALVFGLGFQFILSTRQSEVAEIFLAIAMINLTVEVPQLLERLMSTASGRNTSSLGSLVRTALMVAKTVI